MKLDDRDIICEQDYTTLSNAELVAHIETYARLMHSTPLSAAEWLDDIIGPARVLLARAEAAEALAYERLESAVFAEQRANDAEVERDELRDANSVLSDALETTRQTLVTLTARVAELEAQLAAQGWRPGSETPAPDWYQTVETIDGVFSHAYFDGAVWQGYPDNYPPMWYRPIPPLPPAPNVQEPTP